MENARKIRRVCNFCGKDFILTKSQMRQSKRKWPIHCGRSCARKTQHARNHKDIREIKKCLECAKEFQVTLYDKARLYCSLKCSAISRFGEPGKNKEKLRDKISSIFRDEKYFGFIKSKAIKIAIKYGVDSDDILQDYFTALLEGHNAFIEQTAMDTIRRDYNRGIVGKRKAGDVTVARDALELLSIKGRKCSHIEKLELLADLKSELNEYEFKIAQLMLFGFGAIETKEMITTGNDRFWKAWEKLNGNDSTEAKNNNLNQLIVTPN